MKNFKNPHDIAGQSNTNVQKSQKHEVNLQKNSTLYFQIGLILCLLATYGLFEMEFEKKNIQISKVEPIDEISEIYVKPFIVEPNVKVEKQVKQKSQKLNNNPPVIVKNNVDVVPTVIDLVKPTVFNKPVDPNSFNDLDKPEKSIELPFDLTNVEVVPIYPGCEKASTNNERIKCMSKKLGKLIQRKFNTDLAGEYGLTGIQKINVQFKIDKSGNITEVKTRAPLAQLEDEARRVVKKIPQMTPGKQREKPVSVIYNLPIVFQVR